MAQSIETKIDRILKRRDFWLVVSVLIFGFYSGFFKDLFFSSGGKVTSKEAVIEIQYQDSKRIFKGEPEPEMSLLDALLAASRGGNFEIRYALLNDSTDILDIAGIIEDGLDGRWHFYLNGKGIKAAKIHKTKIKAGDEILAKFE